MATLQADLTTTRNERSIQRRLAIKKQTDRQLRCVDLFAGAGGLALGFHGAGFECLLFNEIDEVAAGTFAHNFPNAKAYVCPIQELNVRRIKDDLGSRFANDLDIVVGGPPCQGFSIYAPKRSDGDSRNHLFNEYVRLVLEGLRPKFVLMENVPGLVSLDGGKTLAAVSQAFENAGYRMSFHILNAAHYGVPEERWRLFFLGTRLPNVQLSFPSPFHYSVRNTNFTGGREYVFRHAVRPNENPRLFPLDLLPPTTVEQAISDLPEIKSNAGDDVMPYDRDAASVFQKAMRVSSRKLFNHHCNGVEQINLERLRYITPGGSWRQIPERLLPAGLKRARRSDHTRRYGRLHPGEPSGTILTRCDPHWGTFFHYSQDRIISVREAARLQSFPDWFRFLGSCTDQYKQVGNAVPPVLAKAIAEHIKGLLASTRPARRARK